MQLFKPCELNRKHKFKGKELLEVVKRMKLVTEPVGKLLCEEGSATNGYYIIV